MLNPITVGVMKKLMIIWFRAGRKHPQGLSKHQVEQVSQLMVLISVFIPSWFARYWFYQVM